MHAKNAGESGVSTIAQILGIYLFSLKILTSEKPFDVDINRLHYISIVIENNR